MTRKIDAAILAKLYKCICDSNQAIFYCEKQTCQNRINYPLYCNGCKDKHSHGIKYVDFKCNELLESWNKCKNDANNVKELSIQAQIKLRSIALYFENVGKAVGKSTLIGTPYIQMLEDLKKFCEELENFIENDTPNIRDLAVNYHVLKLDSVTPLLLQSEEKVTKYSFLTEELTEQKIWDSYHQLVPFIPESGVTTKDLPSDIKDMITEMRLRFQGGGKEEQKE